MKPRRLLVLALLPGSVVAQPATRPTAPDSAPPRVAVDLVGELRTRAELDRRPGATPADGFTALRTRLGARASLGGRLRAVVGVQGNGVVAADGAPGEDRALDLYEGYLELGGPWRGARLALRAGRQELAVGNERLVGRRNWSVGRFSFDGVRVLAGPAGRGDAGAGGGWSATAFAVTPAEHAPPGAPGRDPLLVGAHAVRPFAAATAEATLVHDRGVRARGREVTGRTTAAGRLRTTWLPGLSADLEAAAQVGAQHAVATATAPAGPVESIRAWMVGARVGTAARPGRRLTAGLGVDVLSGDAPGAPGAEARRGAFDTLFGSNHGFYGLGDVAGGNPAATLRGRGLVDALATVGVTATRWVALRSDLHRMAPAHGGGVLGWELDVVPSVRLRPGTTIEAGYTGFRVGAAGAALGLGPVGGTRGRSYLQVTAGF